jgi:hypothetical protein
MQLAMAAKPPDRGISLHRFGSGSHAGEIGAGEALVIGLGQIGSVGNLHTRGADDFVRAQKPLALLKVMAPRSAVAMMATTIRGFIGSSPVGVRTRASICRGPSLV